MKRHLEERGWNQVDLAYVLGVNASGISAVLNDKRGISADMARALSAAFGVPGDTFVKAQANWDMHHAKAPDPSVAARAKVQGRYPLREMIKRGWLSGEKAEALEEQLCAFFGVPALDEVPHLAHAAKKSRYADVPPAQLAWLFRVRQIASEMIAPSFRSDRLSSALEKMKLMLETPEELRHVPRLLEEAGVRFVLVEGLPGSRIDGVCLWLDENSPVIGMSSRFDRIDNFWFVLIHECAHVLNGDGKVEPIIDLDLHDSAEAENEMERKANEMAAEFLLPRAKIQSFYERKKPFFAERDVLAFAKIMKVHPGLVVGQLQRILGRYDLLRRYLVPVRGQVRDAALMDGWGDIIPVNSEGNLRELPSADAGDFQKISGSSFG